MKYLLMLKVPIIASKYKGITPLHYACKEGNVEIVKLLLEEGCDPNWPDRQGRTCLHFASLANQPEIIRLLSENSKVPVQWDV